MAEVTQVKATNPITCRSRLQTQQQFWESTVTAEFPTLDQAQREPKTSYGDSKYPKPWSKEYSEDWILRPSPEL